MRNYYVKKVLNEWSKLSFVVATLRNRIEDRIDRKKYRVQELVLEAFGPLNIKLARLDDVERFRDEVKEIVDPR